MNWIEMIVHTTTPGADWVSDCLVEHGANGTMIEDKADIPDPSKPHGYWEIVDPALPDSMPEDVLVHAWFVPGISFQDTLSVLQSVFSSVLSSRSDFGSLLIETRTVSDNSWSEVWKKYYKPFYACSHLVIKPTWEPFEAAPDDRIIEIDPGMAFGSGTHETTGMCISLLEETIHGGERVIDLGTGSGILAIAAALFGAGHVLAVDIDEDAVRVAKENVRHNNVESIVDVRNGDLLNDSSEICNTCVVNIISDVIIACAEPLKKHILPDGRLICSGVVRERTDEVRNALLSAKYTILKEEYRGEWTAFLCRRND